MCFEGSEEDRYFWAQGRLDRNLAREWHNSGSNFNTGNAGNGGINIGSNNGCPTCPKPDLCQKFWQWMKKQQKMNTSNLL